MVLKTKTRRRRTLKSLFPNAVDRLDLKYLHSFCIPTNSGVTGFRRSVCLAFARRKSPRKTLPRNNRRKRGFWASDQNKSGGNFQPSAGKWTVISPGFANRKMHPCPPSRSVPDRDAFRTLQGEKSGRSQAWTRISRQSSLTGSAELHMATCFLFQEPQVACLCRGSSQTSAPFTFCSSQR